MIIRDEPGGMLLIPQTEHSQLVAGLATGCFSSGGP